MFYFLMIFWFFICGTKNFWQKMGGGGSSLRLRPHPRHFLKIGPRRGTPQGGGGRYQDCVPNFAQWVGVVNCEQNGCFLFIFLVVFWLFRKSLTKSNKERQHFGGNSTISVFALNNFTGKVWGNPLGSIGEWMMWVFLFGIWVLK